ncbi:DSBA family thioredoxin domain containing [Micractinium conductrix]|uniref:DSBA family thioredoxin domain containing n=1 Tax=Micractinium conductrix TaxID=554055 RepID=A0A2P6V2Q6_9CHLO|nr:DSBA family thioredoxin domain containing [Micractinium conductrix]|eukprot:PSC68373.1 DSBA family thioredoxin domain containing [Micractinium conductrix]
MESDSFGGSEEVLLAQEVTISRLQEERSRLVAETQTLGAALSAQQAQLRAAQHRTAEQESRAAALSSADARRLSAAAARADAAEEEAARIRHRAANDRILLEQAERGRREAEEQLGPALKQNAELRQRLAAAQRQVSQLESLQPFADGLQEQQQQARDEAAALSSALDAANARVRQLEGRCVELEGELAGTAAALTSARRLIDRHEERGRARQHQHHHQQRSGSLTPSELCDLEGATSAFVGGASPQRTARSGGADAASPSGLPSRRRALQQRQAVVQAEQQRRHAEENVQQEKGAAAERAQHHSLVAGLQQQLLEQQRQLAHLQLQQSVALGGGGGDPQPPAEATLRLQTLQRDVEKLQRRNNSLQTALAEASLQHARASAAAGRQVQEAQQDAAQLRRQCDAAQAQLTQLQAAAEALHDDGYAAGGSNAGSAEQLEQLLEYATRCNAVVELNAALLQEKKAWLDKLRAAEAEAERCREEAQHLRVQHLQLCGSGGSAAAAEQQQERVQRLLEAQAAEAALRSVLNEAREELVAACKALSGELRRVHALERLRISDMAEVQRLQRRLHELQRGAAAAFKALAQQQQHRQQRRQGAAVKGEAQLAARPSVRVDIWSDISCPWCWVGKKRFDKAVQQFEGETGIEVAYYSYIIDHGTAPQGEEYLAYNVRRWGSDGWCAGLRRSGLPDGAAFSDWRWWPDSMRAHQLLLLAQDQGKGRQAKEALLRATYEEGQNLFEVDALVAVGAALAPQQTPDELRSYLQVGLEEDSGRAAVLADDKRGKRELDISGVPYFIVGPGGSSGSDGPSGRRFALSGAQPTSAFVSAISKALSEQAA